MMVRVFASCVHIVKFWSGFLLLPSLLLAPQGALGEIEGRAAAAAGPSTGPEDFLEDFPHYGMITSIEELVADKMAEIWKFTDEASLEERRNRTWVNDVYWPKVLGRMRDAHFAMRDMDNKILFKRKPSALMDALFKVNSLRALHRLVLDTDKSPEEELKLRYFELSSAATQIHRFYAKRMRDILSDEPRLGMVAHSILNYKGYTWTNKNMTSSFGITKYMSTPGMTEERLLFMDGTKDVFTGIRELFQRQPEVVLNAQFDGKVCEDNETLFNIEPAGLDGPYYVLFHLCLTDIKFYTLTSFAYLYSHVFKGHELEGQQELRESMRASVQRKIDFFDAAFASFMNGTGPSYQTYPGVGICDPRPTGPDRHRNWVYDESYLKLTNFIKVFVAREQSLHRAGNCMQTCDVMDATYKVCPETDTDCILDEELDCLTKQEQCDSFRPPCPAGQYQCQNASSVVSYCPSNRYDRLYEYIRGYDFHFGPLDMECETQAVTVKGNWKIEQDILMDTPHFCDVCTCYCFEPLRPLLGDFSVRYMSTSLRRSRFKLGYIVVGVKFERVEDTIQLRIAEAKALPGNKVNVSTIEWAAPEKGSSSETVRLSRDLRSFNLDDVVTQDPDRVVTGIKIHSSSYLGHVQYLYLGIQILTHKIHPNGTIDAASGKITRNANSTAFRTRYDYPEEPDGPDDPIQAVGPALPDTTSNQYIVFVGTSLVKDAAQSTIPYFDSQKLIRKNPSWLKGIGVYHKSRQGYGGFLSLKLIEHHDE